MSEIEKRIMSTFEKVLPVMDENEREKLLVFGEGFALGIERSRADRAQDSA